MTNMYHTEKWEGPCRFNVVSPEEEKQNAVNSFERFKSGIKSGAAGIDPELAEIMEPSLILFVEDFKLREEDLAKLDSDARAADVLYVDPSGSSIAAIDLAKRYDKPVILSYGLNCRTVDISAYGRSMGYEIFVPHTTADFNDTLALLRARKVFSRTKILYPTDRGWPSVASVAGINDPYKLKEQFGIGIDTVTYEALSKEVERVQGNAEELEKAGKMADIIFNASEHNYIQKKYVVKSMEFYLAVINLMNKHECNAFTIECFEFCTSRLPEKWNITPCLIHTMFKDLGIPSACEGDLGGLLSMQMLMSLSKKSSHLGNMFYREPGKMEINHSAPGIRMNGYKEAGLKYELGRFVAGGWGSKAVVDFMQNDEKTITVARMNPDATGLLVLEGTLVDSQGAGEDKLGCSVAAYVVGSKSGSADEFMRRQTDYGNHLVWVYGNYSGQLTRLGKLLKINVEVVS
jgi:L-fucose isomerase-like protein